MPVSLRLAPRTYAPHINGAGVVSGAKRAIRYNHLVGGAQTRRF